MNKNSRHPRLEKFLRFFSAYAWFVFFILSSLWLTWCLRSDILVLCVVFKVPIWLTKIIEGYGIFIMLIPYILMIGVLEGYMNTAAQKAKVLKRALKVLAVEGGIGLVIIGLMGFLAMIGYPPVL